VSHTQVRVVGVSAATTISNSRCRLYGWTFGLTDVADGDIVFRNGLTAAASIAFTIPLGAGERTEMEIPGGALFTDGLFISVPTSAKGAVFFD
jgi:hypothetical protein